MVEYDEQGQPIQQRKSAVGGLASVATTGVLIGREFSDKFRTKTDDMMKKGLEGASKHMDALANKGKAFAISTKDAAGHMTGLGKSADVSSKIVGKMSGGLMVMRGAVDGLSKGFANIGKGSANSLMAIVTKGDSKTKMAAFAAGLRLIALGFTQITIAAAPLMVVLLPIIAVIVALVAIFKLVKFTISLFSKEIKDMKEKALAPWGDSLTKVGDALRRTLAPAVALVMMVIKGFFLLVQKIGEVVGPILEKMADASGGAFSKLEKGITFVIETVLQVVQYFVNGVVEMINFIKVTFAIFTSDKSPSEKIKLFARAVGAFILNMVRHVIELMTNLNHASATIVAALVNAILTPIKWLVTKWIELWRDLGDKIFDITIQMIEPLAGILAKGINAILKVINTAIDGVNIFLKKSVEIRHVGYTSAESIMGGLAGVRAAYAATAQAAIAFIDKIRVDPEMLSAPFDFMKDKALAALNVLEEKFGLNMKDIAAEVGVDLLDAPDLVANFRKLLAQAKLKIEDHNLNKKLDKLGETIDRINDKDVKIEINPLIQITIGDVNDPDAVRKIALDAVDEGLAKAGARIAVDANAGEI